MTEVETQQLNCHIFRHGGYTTFQPIHPHAKEGGHVSQRPGAEPEWPPKNGQIYGCGKPFRVVNQGDKLVAVKCGWI